MSAYKVELTGFDGPLWMKNTDPCYDVVAKVPPGATRDQFRLMLQNLLVERFHLSVHHEARTLLCSALVVGKGGPRLKASAGQSPAVGPSADGAPPAKSLATGAPWTVTLESERYFRLAAKRMDLKSLAAFLESMLQAPVADETGLAGYYEFTLNFFPPGYPLGEESDPSGGDEDFATDIRSALQRQLGLKLNAAQKLSRDVLVVDHVDNVPTEN